MLLAFSSSSPEITVIVPGAFSALACTVTCGIVDSVCASGTAGSGAACCAQAPLDTSAATAAARQQGWKVEVARAAMRCALSEVREAIGSSQ